MAKGTVEAKEDWEKVALQNRAKLAATFAGGMTDSVWTKTVGPTILLAR